MGEQDAASQSAASPRGEHLGRAYWKKGDPDRHFEENLKHAELHGVPTEVLERLRQIFAAEGRAGMLKLALHAS
jgi:hypothetical protein